MPNGRAVLLRDGFSRYPVSTVPNTYSPWGEYHCHPDEGRLGPWAEATAHYSWRDSGGIWRVVEEGGRHVLEATYHTGNSYPLIVTGEEEWEGYTLEASIRRLSTAGPSGLVVGYKHSRDFLVLLITEEALTLAHRRHAEDTVLASTEVEGGFESYRRVSVACGEASIDVSIDGEPVMEAKVDFPGGPVGLLANAPTRFADVLVTAEQASASATQATTTARAAELAELREQYPQPALWRKLSTRGFGTDRNLRVGDINGDGQNEIVVAQHTRHLGSGDFCEITALTALDLAGNILWQLGEPAPQRWETTADLCFQLHDLDGDGKAELLYTRDLELRVADGATGETQLAVPTPETSPPKAAGAHPMRRIIGDCLYFCDFTGDGRQDAVILKDRYTECWAYDAELNLQWSHRCTTGHYPTSYDTDSDGREELLMGYTLLSWEGGVRWELDAIDHADSSVIWHNSEGKLTVAIAGSDAGFFLLDGEGRTFSHFPVGHAQTICLAELRADVPGLQLVVNTYWGEAGVTLILDEKGTVLREFEPMHYACLLQPVNWTNDGTDLVLLSSHAEQGGLMDGHGRRVVMFPDDGHPVLCSDVKDIDGDGVDEILAWDYESIWIYKPDPAPEQAAAEYPLRNAFHNDSNYRGQWSLPRG